MTMKIIEVTDDGQAPHTDRNFIRYVSDENVLRASDVDMCVRNSPRCQKLVDQADDIRARCATAYGAEKRALEKRYRDILSEMVTITGDEVGYSLATWYVAERVNGRAICRAERDGKVGEFRKGEHRYLALLSPVKAPTAPWFWMPAFCG